MKLFGWLGDKLLDALFLIPNAIWERSERKRKKQEDETRAWIQGKMQDHQINLGKPAVNLSIQVRGLSCTEEEFAKLVERFRPTKIWNIYHMDFGTYNCDDEYAFEIEKGFWAWSGYAAPSYVHRIKGLSYTFNGNNISTDPSGSVSYPPDAPYYELEE